MHVMLTLLIALTKEMIDEIKMKKEISEKWFSRHKVLPIVRFTKNETLVVEPELFTVESLQEGLASRSQSMSSTEHYLTA